MFLAKILTILIIKEDHMDKQLQAFVDMLKMGIDPRDLIYLSVEEMHKIAMDTGRTIHEIRKQREGYLEGDAYKTAFSLIAGGVWHIKSGIL